MKWINKGHEFDASADKILDDYKNRPYVYVFGAGGTGNEVLWILKKLDCFSAFIDNDVNKQKMGFQGNMVISLDTFIGQGCKGIIIVAALDENAVEIQEQLLQNNLIKGKDFYPYQVFFKKIFPIISVYYYGKYYFDVSQISVTERCTLKCEKCAHACGYVSGDSVDMALEDVLKSADYFFEYVDYINEFVLIGGEPLLYKDLTSALEYIGKKYRDRIRYLAITTNGSIMPSPKLLEVCKRYDVLFLISDYSQQVPQLKPNYEKMKRLLNENGIRNFISDSEAKWKDYGFEMPCRNYDERKLIHVFDQCQTHCREIRGSKLYFCVMARSVSENMKLNVGMDDCLDLVTLQGEPLAKKILMEFDKGYSNKGYLEMCNFCNGKDAERYPIPPAVQMNRRES